MTQNFPCLSALLASIRQIAAQKEHTIIGIDGRCGSGKTTLAKALSQQLSCPVIHMDHFFLRPHMRTPERLAQPGGNVDKERFLTDVSTPLQAGVSFTYTPFDCSIQDFGTPISIPSASITVIEGSYCMIPELWNLYDLRLFLTIDPHEQLRRIEARNGAKNLSNFKERWIPLEEQYFSAFRVMERCDRIIDTTQA